MVHDLATQSGGRFTLVSAVGRGTTAEITLPVSIEHPETPAAWSAAQVEPGAGTVLLVDDEELVRMSIAYGLRDLGFTVVEAASAAGALELLDQGLKPDVLVSDHMMPGMPGATLAREARVRQPTLAVLIITGYGRFGPKETEDFTILAKPFTQGELAGQVRELMQRSPTPALPARDA
jgi:CheY-like chemotaxis protein